MVSYVLTFSNALQVESTNYNLSGDDHHGNHLESRVSTYFYICNVIISYLIHIRNVIH